MDIEMKLISKEMVKPSKPTPLNLKSYKLSLLNQLGPKKYIPIILFYPPINNNAKYDIEQKLVRLKNSLSETLTLYYPLAGRMKNHVSVDCTDDGVMFVEARVDCCLSEYIGQTDLRISTMFFPFDPQGKEFDLAPLVALQVTTFACGGLAITLQAFHKVLDVASASTFLNTWAQYNSDKPVLAPDLSSSSTLFPAIQDPSTIRLVHDILEGKEDEKQYSRRRFVFDKKSIDTIKSDATSEDTPNPSSVEALMVFLCKKFLRIRASTRKDDFGMVFVSLSVNLRPRMDPPLPQHTFGNILWLATAFVEEPDPSVAELGVAINDMITNLNADAIKNLQGDEGRVAVVNLIKDLEELFKSVKVDIFNFSSWRNLGLYEIDFGWGNPFWVGQNGDYTSFMDLPDFVMFQNSGCGGIEAWINLENDEMDALENDPEFLELTTKNPSISCD